jgi:hypothetical protein
MPVSSLIFIVGPRRSGTTLLNSILCSDPTANPLIGEAQPLTHLLAAIAWCHENFERMARHYLPTRTAWEDYGRSICSSLVEHCWNTQRQPQHLILKNPELSFHVKRLSAYFPTAKFVVSVRDPRDQIASEHDVIARRGTMPAEAFNAASLARQYVRALTTILTAAEGSPGRFHFVQYEQLVTDPIAECRRLADFCQLDLAAFSPDTQWQRMAVTVDELAKRPSFSKLYGQPLTSQQVGRYRQVLTQHDIKAIEDITEPLMERFSYPRAIEAPAG